MEKIKIAKNGITRFILEKDSRKWAERGYKRVGEQSEKATTKVKAKASE